MILMWLALRGPASSSARGGHAGSRSAHARTTDATTGNRGARSSSRRRISRRRPDLQALPGITVASAGHPLFIPFLGTLPNTPESVRSSIHSDLRTMARPGLEPGTPRFSVADRNPSNRVESPAIQRESGEGHWTAKARKFHSFLTDSGTQMRFGTQCRSMGRRRSRPRPLLGLTWASSTLEPDFDAGAAPRP